MIDGISFEVLFHASVRSQHRPSQYNLEWLCSLSSVGIYVRGVQGMPGHDRGQRQRLTGTERGYKLVKVPKLIRSGNTSRERAKS